MATASLVSGEHRVLLDGVSWQAYEALLSSWANRPVRLTYDHGMLEIMSPLHSHEQFGAIIAQLIEAYTVEENIPRHTGGSTTFRHEAKRRGLEPDECYWIQNERAMRGRKEFDPETDPPPDLAIEIDITSSSIDRMSVYASLGVSEVWRFDGETLTIHLLQSGVYIASAQSPALPNLPPDEVLRFVRLSDEEDETTLMRTFQAWVRKNIRDRKSAKTPRRRKRS